LQKDVFIHILQITVNEFAPSLSAAFQEVSEIHIFIY